MKFRYPLKSVCILFLISAATFALGQTELKPGFNLFSPEQDVEIGKQSAIEIERQMPVLKNQKVQRYVQAIGKRLADNTPGPQFPYQFKVVNVADVNAFALPGGFMYIHRGLIEEAETEAELAGVMAHEISHVALRHGTNQASKAYLSQAGLSILGSLLGGGGGSTADIISAVGGFGLNATFLKFSRDAEKQADLLGTQILARSGYDASAMAEFFQTLRELQGRDPSKMEVFFSSHPAPADRSEYVKEEISQLRQYRAEPVGNFKNIKSILKRLPKAPTMNDLASGKTTGTTEPVDRTNETEIVLPSKRMLGYESADRLFRIWYPSNWEPVEGQDQKSVSFLPENGVLQTKQGQHIVYGAVVNRFEYNDRQRVRGPFSGRNSLERGTNALIATILQGNDYLQVKSDSIRESRTAGRNSLMLRLSGVSPATSAREVVVLQTVRLKGNLLLYALFIAPENQFNRVLPTFQKMAESLQIPG